MPSADSPLETSPRAARSAAAALLADLSSASDPSASCAPAASPAPASPAPASPASPAPGTLVDWAALAPDTWYARRGARLLSLAVLAAGLPLALVVGAAIACVNLLVFRDPRQVFFVQPRAGWRGREFALVKFRTMRAVRDNFAAWSSDADRLRVTRFGRLLRNMHLDELPQLVNVLRGDMNLIGPRPEMLEVEAWAASQVPGFSRRLAVRPGLTGLAQVTQGYTSRDAAAYAQKLAINDDYLRRLSFALDLQIVGMTIVWMLRGKGWAWNGAARASQAAAGPDAAP